MNQDLEDVLRSEINGLRCAIRDFGRLYDCEAFAQQVIEVVAAAAARRAVRCAAKPRPWYIDVPLVEAPPLI